MFGSVGLPEVSPVLLILGLLGAIAFRRGGSAVAGPSGPTLVLRRFDVSPNRPSAVTIEGRPAGLVAWLLTTVGVDTLTTLRVSERDVSLRSANLSGEIHVLLPIEQISSTHCG